MNHLDGENLIIMLMFGMPGNKDAESLAMFKEVFYNQTIEMIDITK